MENQMRYFMAIFLVLALSAPVMAAKGASTAEETATGGFEGPVRAAQTETIENALKMPEDSPVKLTGNIIASVEGDKNVYIFKDSTGEIPVIITPRQFKDTKVTPSTKLIITGKITKPAGSPDKIQIRVSKLVTIE